MNHNSSVFTNSCLNVPVDPINKMPKTEYERVKTRSADPSSIESCSSCSMIVPDLDLNSQKLKDFYCSIPDYNDINHLPRDEFYSILRNLREKRKAMLGIPAEEIDGLCDGLLDSFKSEDITESKLSAKNPFTFRTRKPTENKRNRITNSIFFKDSTKNLTLTTRNAKMCSKQLLPEKNNEDGGNKNICDEFKTKSVQSSCKLNKLKTDRPKRNDSACSISWYDTKIECKDEIDKKFSNLFESKRNVKQFKSDIEEFNTQSMPASPMRSIRRVSPLRRRKSITITKPFKMTER